MGPLSGFVKIVLLFVLGVIYTRPSFGYKWVPLEPNDPIPENTLKLNTKSEKMVFIGRARHYDEILPAEVKGHEAWVYRCGDEIRKQRFEVLVSTENCQWVDFQRYSDAPENIVHAGFDQYYEPIYIGRKRGYDDKSAISSIFLSSERIQSYYTNANWNDILVCDDFDEWIDSSAANIPNNTISGGISERNGEIFVARIKDKCNIVPGQVIPSLGIATNEQDNIESAYCQVLIGEAHEYKWETASKGFIPEYAIVSGRENNNLQYIAKMNGSIGYLTYTLARGMTEPYEILVRNND